MDDADFLPNLFVQSLEKKKPCLLSKQGLLMNEKRAIKPSS
jgi:hypothetical protein